MSHFERWIIHVDLDAFFASVEELLDPTLRGKPLVVGGDPLSRGVVASASYAARAHGVRSAMPVAQALRLCPGLIVLRHHMDEYTARSAEVMALLREITPAVEQISIDEAFLDVTGCEALWGTAEQIARRIQQRVKSEHSLPISLGVASNKLVAKIACDVGKPQGLVVVPRGQEAAFLAPWPIERLWGVGRVTGARLRSLGMQTIGDLAAWDVEALERLLGQSGRALYAAARGQDASAVQTAHERRSISQERTFAQDIADADVLHRTLLAMSDELAARLRQQQLVAQGVRIKMRTPDFRTVTRQTTLLQPTDQADVIHRHAEELLWRHWRLGQPLRLLGLAVSNLLDGAGYQLALFGEQDRRNIRLSRTLDEIRERFGPEAITRASLLRRSRDKG
jgi:DNA polymerase-4